MRIENNTYYRTNNYNLKQNKFNNTTPSFEGFGIKTLREISPLKIIFPVKQDKLWDECYSMGNKIGIHTRKLAGMLEYAPKSRVDLMRDLTESYNAQNFAFEKGLKEDPKHLLHIYETITKPESAHFNIIKKSQMPFKTLDKIFEAATTKESLEFVQTVQHEILDGSNKSGKIILKMLKSPHNDLFIKNPDDYKSYLKLYSEKEDCVENLNRLVTSGRYDRSKFDKKLLFEDMMSRKYIKDNVGKFGNYIEKKLTKENSKFLKHFCYDFLAFRKGLTEEDNADIMKMFTTTTAKNVDLRIRLINKFRHNYSQAETGVSDIRAMKKLYDHIDSNPYKATFVENALNENIKVESVENLNKIISFVEPEKAAIFSKNIARIVRYTTPAEREAALQTEIENPFFPIKRTNEKLRREVINVGRLPKDSPFDKITKYIENKLNIKKYNKLKEQAQHIESKNTENVFRPSGDLTHTPKISETITAPAKTNAEPKLNISRTLRLSPQARRLQVKSDVNNIIQKKLGQKTYEYQSADYGIKATAMRLKMLPEIFDSISATRGEQRKLGIRPNIENKDALLLYEKITGRNKKLVRYMLKQTDGTGKQLFNIKEIADLIDKTEVKIAQEKKINPVFRAADAKSYYEEIYQNLVTEYGRLKRSKKTA